MKFKIDENLPVEVKDRLVAHGHDAHTVHEEELTDSQDSVISDILTRREIE
jgi:predicted nuclease of predicted toxin-antitoxin system